MPKSATLEPTCGSVYAVEAGNTGEPRAVAQRTTHLLNEGYFTEIGGGTGRGRRTFARGFRFLERTIFLRLDCGIEPMLLRTEWPDVMIQK